LINDQKKDADGNRWQEGFRCSQEGSKGTNYQQEDMQGKGNCPALTRMGCFRIAHIYLDVI
jgi:hypothetical protein